VYNEYAGVGDPTSCAVPSQPGSGNNGSVMGYFYQDTANPSLGHSATYGYDSLSRLTSGVATGNNTYNLTFVYNNDGSGRYGNMACQTNSSTNGPCPNWTFNGNNQITTSGFTYDAAGNLLNDGTYTYVWDAENRLTSDSGPVANTYAYNALGEMVENSRTSASHAELPYDIFGQDLGHYSRESNYWWEEYINFGGVALAFYDQLNETRLLHRNAGGSSIFTTNGSGSYLEDTQYYPWGSSWADTGPGADVWYEQFARMPWNDADKGQYLTHFRRYDTTKRRWLSPDPENAGADPSDPQTWDAYAYVLNNPTTNVDPEGQDCVSASNQTAASLLVTITSGTCNSSGGAYIAGTVDLNSLAYNGSSLSFNYSPYDNNVTFGAATLYLGPGQSSADDINPFGLAVIQSVGPQRANGIYGLMGAFVGGSVLGGSAAAAGLAATAAGAGLTTLGLEAPEVMGPTAARATQVIFRSQQLAHALRVAAGHSTPLGTVPEISCDTGCCFGWRVHGRGRRRRQRNGDDSGRRPRVHGLDKRGR
jgi:RHS repeat-associated protein